ncbi:MAG: hypothetical protein KDC75_11125 [Phaeodactylibacter sp.]|nr:hypothetical protein [Phaeodactylibacter sp.]
MPAYLLGGIEGNVVLVGADNKRTLLGQHQDIVVHVSFFKKDQFAISSSMDAVHKIWDLRTHQLAATIYLFSEDEGYVITTPDGRFDGNANGFEYILLHR